MVARDADMGTPETPFGGEPAQDDATPDPERPDAPSPFASHAGCISPARRGAARRGEADAAGACPVGAGADTNGLPERPVPDLIRDLVEATGA